MSRKFIATIVATAVVVTGIAAAPAKANESDIAKLIFGAATLYVISRALKDDHPRVSTTSSYRPAPVEPRPLPRRAHQSKRIPAQCLRYHETRKGTVRMVGQKCVNRHYSQARRLPEVCHFKTRTFQGMRQGYRPTCLRRNGFKLARH